MRPSIAKVSAIMALALAVNAAGEAGGYR